MQTLYVSMHNQRDVIDNSINGTGNINSWNWNFGDGNGTSTNQNPQYTYDSCGIYNVQLIVTDNYSCSNTCNNQ